MMTSVPELVELIDIGLWEVCFFIPQCRDVHIYLLFYISDNLSLSISLSLSLSLSVSLYVYLCLSLSISVYLSLSLFSLK